MFHIVICDQDEHFALEVGKVLYEFYSTRTFETSIQIYLGGDLYIDDPNSDLDLVLMNTRPNGRMDYVLVEQIRVDHPKAQIFLMSDYEDDVFQALTHHPYYFIRKEHWRSELMAAVKDLWENMHKGHFLQIRQNHRTIAIMIDDIMYLESSGHYVILHCTRQQYRTREKLTHFIEKLQGMYFVQPSKSFLVNCDYIDKCTDVFILKNGKEIVCSKTRYRATLDFYEKYVREMHAECKYSR